VGAVANTHAVDNTRVVCLLKSLTKFGFDGMVPCVRVSGCRHPIVYNDNVAITPNGGRCNMDGIRNIEIEEGIFGSSAKEYRMNAAKKAAAPQDDDDGSMFF
jgi:hypothetical protein